MPDGVTPALAPVIVTLPGDIDVTNAADAEDEITAALIPGVTVVIADLTMTTFCDSAALQHLLQGSKEAAQLRLAIDSDEPIARVMKLTGINRHVPVYPTVQQAAHGGRRHLSKETGWVRENSAHEHGRVPGTQ